MDDVLKRIAGLAWRTVPARDANEAIARARRATAAAEMAVFAGEIDAAASEPGSGAGANSGQAAVSDREIVEEAEDDADAPLARAYELALAPDATFETFARDQLPRTVYHFESIGAHLPQAGGVVICLFAGEDLHFIQAKEFFAAICSELKLTPAELTQRYGTHELRTAVRPDPAPAPSAPANPAFALALPRREEKS